MHPFQISKVEKIIKDNKLPTWGVLESIQINSKIYVFKVFLIKLTTPELILPVLLILFFSFHNSIVILIKDESAIN